MPTSLPQFPLKNTTLISLNESSFPYAPASFHIILNVNIRQDPVLALSPLLISLYNSSVQVSSFFLWFQAPLCEWLPNVPSSHHLSQVLVTHFPLATAHLYLDYLFQLEYKHVIHSCINKYSFRNLQHISIFSAVRCLWSGGEDG